MPASSGPLFNPSLPDASDESGGLLRMAAAEGSHIRSADCNGVDLDAAAFAWCRERNRQGADGRLVALTPTWDQLFDCEHRRKVSRITLTLSF
jgi:hypothetical protein